VIEISRSMKWVFRISPDNPRAVERRKNKSGARWELLRICADEQIAKDSLFQLERENRKAAK
jgi:hypothetical protein